MLRWPQLLAVVGMYLYGLGSLVVGAVLLQWPDVAAGLCVLAFSTVLWLGLRRLPQKPDLTRGTSGPVQSSERAILAGRISRPYSPERIGDPLDGFPDFDGRVWARLQTGRQEYGDESFSRTPLELADEIEEELLDIPGWSYVLWVRWRRLRRKLALAEQLADREDK